ncbi:general stress protein [Sanguibacteroides justesenii]|uniref:pyridoxamine 5'-phosphate oxidase family protein n=1 Tax=Sanguibacteroides justesenii TaxID=1547597 RepID=UPI000D86422B|nr:pyridoxamine 5'-phosphate oxidase family protein [Sanguibacteroides justesenii]PXZ45084.1 general stress protein [Sanguibacteroides justesenii]
MKTLKEQAAEMLKRCETVVVASVNNGGFPRPVPMSKIHSEGYAEVWMATGKDSLKTRDFAGNSKAGLCFSENGNSVVLTGIVEIITDKVSLEKFWQGWFIEHFTGGVTDPNYVLLKFTGHHATFWIDGKFVHRKI